MGVLVSRQRAGVIEDDVVPNHAYKYPPPSGNYFGSHFIMGGERFDTPQPEAYLFGDNSDLNFLGSPTAFPYPPPQPNEPTKTLKSLVNIRKESLRFVRAPVDHCKARIIDGDHRDVELGKATMFNLEFTFDCDVPCSITIYYFCSEEYTAGGVTYIPKDTSMVSETFHYKRGANQQFCQPSHVFDPSLFLDDDLLYDSDRKVIPIAIHCVAEKGPEDMRQSHTTIAVVEKSMDGTHILKALKQKLFVDGLCYLLQEIYGIENKQNDKATGDDDTDDNGSECVVCMSEVRDTLILPCRHLCLCNSCANTLRYQANNCPICRAPFRALLQIRALQKTTNPPLPPVNLPDGALDNIPPGYEAVSLIEALNGPCIPRQPPSAMPDLVETPENEPAVQAAHILNGHSRDSKATKEKDPAGTPEFGMSVLISSRDEDKETTKCPLLATQIDSQSPRGKNSRTRESSRHSLNKESKDDEHINDEDSEAEKLSPLLQHGDLANRGAGLALNMADVVEAIDNSDVDQDEALTAEQGQKNYTREGDESDYYTPEEPNPIQSNPLYDSATTTTSNSVESTPQRLPGAPLSHISSRSSGDSYTSGSSTRHLLAVANHNGSSDKSANI